MLTIWLEECRVLDATATDHDRRSGIQDIKPQTSKLTAVEPIQLSVIDCVHRTVVIMPVDEEYVTLSYLWGSPSTGVEPLDNKRTLPPKLPATIEDSITVCTALGFRYLWIDRYCIPQTNLDERRKQIRRMDEVYQNSVMTIIACAGIDPSYGLPGISQPRTPYPSMHVEEMGGCLQMIPIVRDIRKSLWSTRAWTFQEALLSKRRLYFTEKQVYLETQHHVSSELIASGSPQLRESNRDTRIHSQGVWAYTPLQIYDCIREFTQRSLSFPDDILNAMLGIFALYQLKFSVRHLWGLPFSALTSTSAQQESHTKSITFATSLQWSSKYSSSRRNGFPSWSWTGWYGAVESIPLGGDDVELRTRDIQVQVELASSHLLDWTEYQHGYDELNKDIGKLSRFIHITAWTSPIASATVRDIPLLWNMSLVDFKLKDGTRVSGNWPKELATDANSFRSLLAVCLGSSNRVLVVKNFNAYWERIVILQSADPFAPIDTSKMTRRTIRLG
jgi:hypothetical protein